MTATNSAGDAGLSGAVTESFASALEAPAPTADCAAAMTPHTVGTIHTRKGQIFWVTSGGSFCTVTGQDEFTAAAKAAIDADELACVVAKVEAVGPASFHMDLHLLENRFEFQRALRS